jgi:hypothetical protein
MHPRPARTAHGWRTAIQGDAGYFDLTLVHAGQRRIIGAELKSHRGSLTPEQVTWRDAWIGSGGEYFEWRPEHWANGDIERVLRFCLGEQDDMVAAGSHGTDIGGGAR